MDYRECTNPVCKHRNHTEALYCARCGGAMNSSVEEDDEHLLRCDLDVDDELDDEDVGHRDSRKSARNGERFSELSCAPVPACFDYVTETPDPSGWRLAGAFAVGITVGPLLGIPIRAGVFIILRDEFTDWGIFFWDNHAFWRVVASVASAVGASVLAALVARKCGHVISALCMLPFALLWGIVAYLCWSGQAEALPWQGALVYGGSELAHTSKGNLIAATALALGLTPIGYIAGQAVTPMSVAVYQHFASRPWSWFGVKWYHYLWAVPIAYPVIAVTAQTVVYGSHWLIVSLESGRGLIAAIPNILLLAVIGTLYLLVAGPVRAYMILAGFEVVDRASVRFLRVLQFGIGFPILAVIAQLVINLIHRGLVWLVS